MLLSSLGLELLTEAWAWEMHYHIGTYRNPRRRWPETSTLSPSLEIALCFSSPVTSALDHFVSFSPFSPFFQFLPIFLIPMSMQPPSLTLKLPVGPFPWNLRCLELLLSFGKWVQIFILEIALLQNITVHLSCWVHNPPPQNTFLHTLL